MTDLFPLIFYGFSFTSLVPGGGLLWVWWRARDDKEFRIERWIVIYSATVLMAMGFWALGLPSAGMTVWIIFGFSYSAAIWPAMLGWLWIVWRHRAGWYEMTPDERHVERLRRDHEKAEKRRLKEIKRVSKGIRKDLIAALARIGFTYIYQRQGAVAKASKPKIRHVLYGKDALWFRIDQMPFRTQATQLLEEDVSENLALSIGREIRVISQTDIGVWIQVSLKSGISAIPKYFAWHSKRTDQNAAELLPKTRPWTIALGMTENRKFVYEDARRFPHLIVAGATGGGKSVFMNQMLCSLLQRLTPDQLEIVLIDLKGGLEFWPYREIPHLRREVVTKAGQVPDALVEIMTEKERRFAMLRNHGHKDIRGWNSTQRQKMPYVLILFDEIANLMLNSKLKRKVEALVQDLAAQGRALGLHMVLCTQVPSKAVLNTIIRGNIPARVVFATDHTGSMVALGNQAAAHLPPGGRMIYRRSASNQMECQAPMITEKQIESVIESLDQPEERNQSVPERLFYESLDNLAGKFSYRALYDALGGEIPQHEIKSVAQEYSYSFEERGPVIELNRNGNESRYILAPVNRRGDRHLLPVNGRLPADLEEVEAILI
jgi:hypothetical protein